MTTEEAKVEKQALLEAVKKNGFELLSASDDLRSDKEVVLEAVRQAGRLLKELSPDLRADRDVVMEAVRQNPYALEWASEDLRADKVVVLEAVRQAGQFLHYAGFIPRGDKEVVLAAVLQNGRARESASKRLQWDKDIALAAARSWVREAGCSPGICFVRDEFNEVLEVAGIAQEGLTTAIATPGEAAPVVTIGLSRISQDPDVPAFECDVSMMSGLNCAFRLTTEGDGDRPEPRLRELAGRVVEELPKHVEVAHPIERVFINFRRRSEGCGEGDGDDDELDFPSRSGRSGDGDGDGDVLAATPWDWHRPLSDFLLTSAPGHA